MRVLILGASGYGGGELLRLLLGIPGLEAVQGVSRRHAGRPVSEAHPNLRGAVDFTFQGEPDWEWLAASERPVLFTAMPHGELAAQIDGLESRWETMGLAERLVVIDLSADFRIADPERYARHYGGAHPAPHRLPEWTYGLTALDREAIAQANRIAAPGCFATALQLGLMPLVRLGVDRVHAFGITGSSGSGMNPGEGTHHPTRAHDFRAYKPLAHQHMAEVEQFIDGQGSRAIVSFMPHSAPLVRGIYVTLTAEIPPDTDIRTSAQEAFLGQPFVRLVEGPPRVAAVLGSHFADIGVAQEGATTAVMVAIDNLVRGMAGHAIEALALRLNLPAPATLGPGLYP